MKYAISQHSSSGQQQPDGLIAMEGFALVFAAESALLLDCEAFQLVVHARRSHFGVCAEV